MMVRLKLEIDLSCAISKYLSLQVFNKCKKKRFIKPNSTTQNVCLVCSKGVLI